MTQARFAPRPLPEAPRKRREGVLPFLVVVVAGLVMVSVVLVPEYQRAREIVDREDVALAAVWRVKAAQEAYHERTGTYGWLEDLEAAGLLRGLDTPGYRIDVLLPHAQPSPQVVQIVTRGDARAPDPELAKAHFAIVARPTRPAVTGHRIWYVDELGDLFLNEGVVDDEGARRNELPETLVRTSVPLNRASWLLWQRATEVAAQSD